MTITGNISLQSGVLALHYCVAGDITKIHFPSSVINPTRKDELWKATCFEYFLAIKDQPQYWEFNLSPSGDWNVYRMDAYRRVGFRQETSIQRLPFVMQRGSNTFTLDATIDLTPILQPHSRLEVGVTAIIQMQDGHETYWSLAHPASHADFHLRESFILELAGQTHPVTQSARDA